jgi:glyceraldehyde-3-phosphate dehydrogenase/erythrose-4-phosphate dehydrogenase
MILQGTRPAYQDTQEGVSMAAKRTIHVVGIGMIGEPLIGLLLNVQQALEVDEITFHKYRPLLADRAKVSSLLRRGAKLVADAEKIADFEKLSLQPTYDTREALEQATVVIDCTPKGLGNRHKRAWYEHLPKARGFIAQGSEFGFGKMYAHGINDAALVPGEDRFIQVVSCNTHNLAVLLDTMGLHDEQPNNLLEGRFVCLRRASDISQMEDFIPAPQARAHNDGRFGTHHARDAWHLFQTLGLELNLFSSEIKLNTQYMHSIWFNLRVKRAVTVDEVIDKCAANPYVALTQKTMANPIFSFGRDHGYFGRVLNQTVVAVPTLAVRNGHEITGFCFTPQDGNSLMSSVAAASWLLDPDTYEERMQFVQPYLFDEI